MQKADMIPETNALIVDLVEWVARGPRPYEQVMDAWRTSCPRLTIWEDAVDRGYVTRERQNGGGTIVRATPAGHDLLRRKARLPEPAVS